MARGRLTPQDLEVSDAERQAVRTLAEGGAGARTAGKTIGGIAGAGLGALGFLVPGVGAVLGPAAMSAGSALGSDAGDAIGGAAAQGALDEAESSLSEAEMERQKKLQAYQLRQEALDALLNED